VKVLTDNIKNNTWYKIPLPGCVASDGSRYSVTIKKGSTNKLLVNFLGGGLSWNEETAANPMSLYKLIRNLDSYYIPYVPSWQLGIVHIGLLSAMDERNPFYDWNVLNIPYVTADFHVGNNEFPYKNAKGESKILHHVGAKNLETVLEV